MKVKSESEVAQSCLTLSDPMDCSLPGFSVHGIFQARILEWGAIAFSNITIYIYICIYIIWKNGTGESIRRAGRDTAVENALVHTAGEGRG